MFQCQLKKFLKQGKVWIKIKPNSAGSVLKKSAKKITHAQKGYFVANPVSRATKLQLICIQNLSISNKIVAQS